MKKLGIIDSFYAEPLFHGLKDRNDTFDLITGSPIQISKMLREKKLDAAFLSPIDYTKGYEEYTIVRDVCVASEGTSRTISLYFNEGLHNISTIATDLTTISEMVLAKIVMIEKYSTVPQFIATTGDMNEMLKKADAALIVGNPNLELHPNYNKKIDLVDEWTDITELPYVHGIWVTNEGQLLKSEVDILIKAAHFGASHLSEIANLQSQFQHQDLVEYLSAFSYVLDEINEASLVEFIRMTYYHEIIEDHPDIKFFGDEISNLSLN